MVDMNEIKKGVKSYYSLDGKNPNNEYIIMAWNDYMIETRDDDIFFFFRNHKQQYYYKDKTGTNKKLGSLSSFFSKEVNEDLLGDFKKFLLK